MVTGNVVTGSVVTGCVVMVAQIQYGRPVYYVAVTHKAKFTAFIMFVVI